MKPPLKERVVQFFSPKGGVWLLSPGFVGKGEEQVIRDLERYSAQVSQTVEALDDIARAYAQKDKGILETAVAKIYRGWEETEKIREEIYRRITEGRLFFPDSRSDMFALMNRMSLLLLMMKDPRVFILPETSLQGELRINLERVITTCKDLSQLVALSVRYMNEDPTKALRETTRQVAGYEKEISRWIEESRKVLAEEPVMDHQILLFLKHLVEISRELQGTLYRVHEIAIKYV